MPQVNSSLKTSKLLLNSSKRERYLTILYCFVSIIKIKRNFPKDSTYSDLINCNFKFN